MAGGPVPLSPTGRRVDWPALALVAVPGAVLVGEAARAPVGPWGDQAAIQLSVERAMHAGQLLGPYSRFGWSHPGPLYFYLLGGPYRLLGSTARGLLVSSVLLTVVSALAVVVVGGLLGDGRLARWSAAVVTVELAALAPGIADQVWNPVATIVPTTLFLICCAGLAAGRWWALVGVVGAGSFLVQTDVGTGLVVVVLATGALAVAVVTARGSFRRRALVVAVLTTGVLWLAPLWQQVTGDPGNLSRLLDFFRPHGGGHSWADAARAVAGTLWPPLRGRLRGSAPGGVTTGVVLGVTLALAAAVIAVGRRRRDALMAALGGASALAVVVGILSAQRVTGPLFPYLVEWLSAAAAVLAIGAVLALERRLASGGAAAGPGLAAGAGAIALAVVAVVQPPTVPPGGAQVDRLWSAARPLLPAPGTAAADPTEVALGGSQDWPWGAGLLVDATRDHYRATAQTSWLFLFGTQFTPSRAPGAVVWVWQPGADPPPPGREVGRAGSMAVSVSLPVRSP